ncbi:MAG TPA: peptidoglycan amidohydrolase family protein [Candidatus Paceibacterota bacterium]|nr:peptidoglycan amidohydrolase family protein [Candidatus Paceibacterota bacterium]
MSNIKILTYNSYLKMIKNSVGTKMFRNLYLKKSGKEIDATKNGNLSCAFFVSNILLMWGLIKEGHANVPNTIKDMLECGWQEIAKDKIKLGDVIVWEKQITPNGKLHLHNGFYIGDKKAISNYYKMKTPVIHSWDYNGKRKIIAVYHYQKFK